MIPAAVAVFLFFAALCAVAAIAVSFSGAVRWSDRHYRHAQGIRTWVRVLGLAAAASAVGYMLNPRSPDPVFAVTLAASVCGIVVVAAIVAPATQRLSPTMPTPTRVLAIGAHPDDVELACGAALARLADEGCQVHTLVMSHGESGGHAAARTGEARRGSAYLGAAHVTVCEFPDTALSEHEHAMVLVIEAEIAAFAPDVILTHSEHDQHQDHEAVHWATMRAARNCPSILCFESPSVTRAFDPSVFIDVSDYLDVKEHAVDLHRDQAAKSYMGAARIRGVAAFRGAQAKLPAAEGFEVVRLEPRRAGML